MDDTKLFECARPEFITRLNVTRIEDQGMLQVNLQTESQHLTLHGYEALADSVSDMLMAELIVISEVLNTGQEFGTIRIECWVDESYSVYWCDSANFEQT
ncbi:hypothetical protein [Photobacterium sp. 1_MG-2023]|uniref:hypothetical protein n=1 Tax=Photobacterium sp. 1_MG-2023 TaxID=3062646 RepID=UPI0026E31508|nr:hypothetical protein [Photobacterium sp. 1_MG-2023]MDO6707394.1 hypothetical protein [Photobacterium sp. 1_MG-2023]